jgi:hypothetical protein
MSKCLQDRGRGILRAYHRRQLAVLWVLVVVGIGIITYAPAVSPYLHSDDFVLVNWARLGASANGPLWFDAGIARAWGFLPLVLAILGTIHQIVGATGYLYHVVQLGVHFAVSLLAGLLSYRALAGSASQRAAAGLVGIAVLVWPVYHEAVMWVSAIAYPLAGAVGLLALIPWSTRLPSPRGYLASLTVFAAAMLSHRLAVAYAPSLFALVVVGVGDRRTRLRGAFEPLSLRCVVHCLHVLLQPLRPRATQCELHADEPGTALPDCNQATACRGALVAQRSSGCFVCTLSCRSDPCYSGSSWMGDRWQRLQWDLSCNPIICCYHLFLVRVS